jgi:8-oxo-dGTP pyrophosphatase MutT (NUDIX family)
MANERLRRAIQGAGLRLEDVAEHVEIDAKTVERWITLGRLPHARNRARTAQLLSVDELELWPEVADEKNGRGAADGELVRLYAHRGAVPRDWWYQLLEATRERLDLLVYAGLFLPDGRSDLAGLVRRKAQEGVQVRLLYGEPGCDAVALRAAEEGIGDGLVARIQLALRLQQGWSEAIGEAAVRETKEETGVDCEITGLVGIYTNPRHVILYTSDGEVRQECSVVLAARAVGGEPTPSSESSEVRWVSPAELAEFAMHPSMRLRVTHYLEDRDRPYIG